MALIHRAGDSMIFRQNTSTPGGTVWPIAAHSIAQNFPITIVAHVTVSITGADQALFSLGTAAARMLEVGVDGTGQPYAWGSGAQVILGAALTAGDHVLAFIVSEGGTVSLLADIDYFGLGTVAMGTAVSRACAGVSCLGTLPWAGTYSDVRVYASDDDEAAIGAMGLAGERTVWTPADWGTDRLVDYTADDVLTAGAAVTAFVDQTGTANATQALAGRQATLATHYGKNFVVFDGTTPGAEDQYDIAGLAYAGTSWSVFALYDMDINTQDKVLFDTQTGRLFMLPWRATATTRAGFFDGAYRDFANGTASLNLVSEFWVFNGTTSVATLYRAGASVSTSAFTPRQIGGSAKLGCAYNTTASAITGKLRRFGILKRVATDTDIANWAAYTIRDVGA